jgi:phospholipid/cholesterol/gamma-HCH transport system ATP-binding protein
MEAESDQVVIRAHDLVVGFGGQTVLDHLSLDVRRGEILGLVGASGSGKSVLLRTVIGLVPKRSGSVEFFALGPDGPTAQDAHAMARHWGVLFQQGALFSSLTVRQNIQFPLREFLNLSDRLLDELATAKLEMVG